MSGPPGAMGPSGDWESLYATSDVATLPWYTTALDADIERALQEHDLRGRRILDLGTGPATQAMNLAKRGFDVLATDISLSAIKKAKASAKSAGLSIEFRVDNVLASKLARTWSTQSWTAACSTFCRRTNGPSTFGRCIACSARTGGSS